MATGSGRDPDPPQSVSVPAPDWIRGWLLMPETPPPAHPFSRASAGARAALGASALGASSSAG